MYFADDSLLPENQEKLIITAAPYAPQWLPRDYPEDIPVTWDEQVQAAVDCYNAGATHLHIHVRNPQTGRMSTNFEEYNYLLYRLKHAVPKMILSVSGAVSFSSPEIEGGRRLLAELNPKPEQVTVAISSRIFDRFQMWTADDADGTHLSDISARDELIRAWTETDPCFHIEQVARLKANGIQPYFMLGHVHELGIVERLIRAGVYLGPLNHCLVAVGGECAGANPFDWMEYLRRSPNGSLLTFESTMRMTIPMSVMAIALGVHVRVGIEDNIWRRKGERFSTVKQIEQVVRIANEMGRGIASADEARQMMKLGVWYKDADEALANLGLPSNREQSQRRKPTYSDPDKFAAGVYA